MFRGLLRRPICWLTTGCACRDGLWVAGADFGGGCFEKATARALVFALEVEVDFGRVSLREEIQPGVCAVGACGAALSGVQKENSMTGNNEDKSPAEPVFYPQDPINGFLQGCLLDLRVRLAIDFLKAPSFELSLSGMKVEDAAGLALRLADEILAQGAANGWVTSIPEDGEIGPALRAQAKRNAQYQVVQQMEANKAMTAEQSSIAVPQVPMPGRKMN